MTESADTDQLLNVLKTFITKLISFLTATV